MYVSDPFRIMLKNILEISKGYIPLEMQRILFPLIFIGFGVIGALFPFHTWSPDGHSSAPTAVSMLHAGVLMKLGGYGCLKVAIYLLPEAANELSWFFLILTGTGVIYGAFATIMQTDLKYINAYSSVSHCGLVLFALLMLNKTATNGAVLQMISHGLMTALFFALIGMIYSRTKTRIVQEMGGLLKVMPFLSVCYVIAGLASLGLPGLSGFVAEMTIFVGAFEHPDLFRRVLTIISWSLLLIFIGGAGKSAMFPLHIWLPDAMEGPTPVSALIHAATMVVAGVYLVARLFPIFYFQAPEILDVVAFIGAFSALFAAVIACTQKDIKRILAFSTMSQIGYMMLALGVSGFGENGLGFTASMFHLFTHAFFKALLFLGAGAIIHAVHSNNIFEMGALRKKLPVTHFTYLIACLAISGIPPFSGFFSKDEILAAAYAGHPLIYTVALLVAGLTSVYMFRLYFLVFWNQPKYHGEPQEPPRSMTIPLIVLAIGSVVVGWVPFNQFVSTDGAILNIDFHFNIAIMASSISLLGIAIALILYKNDLVKAEKLKNTFGNIYQAAYKKFYFDDIYIFVTRKIIFNLISRPIAWFDRYVVDATIDAIGSITNWFSEEIKEFQSGQVQQYAFVFGAGAILISLLFIYLWI